MTTDLLRSFGCTVERVENGEGRDRAPRFRAACARPVLSDFVMPGGLDSLALAERLRLLYAELPIVLMTGHSEQERRADGADYDVLQKPFAPATLLAALARATASRRISVTS